MELKKRQKVRIVGLRVNEPKRLSWVDNGMSELVGQTAYVRICNANGALLEGNDYWWAENWLEPA